MPSDLKRIATYVTPKEEKAFFDLMSELKLRNVSDTVRRLLDICVQDDEIRSLVADRLVENKHAASNFDEAVTAYHDWCETKGFIFDQPNESLSIESNGRVYLRNIRGYLGQYSIKRGEFVPPT